MWHFISCWVLGGRDVGLSMDLVFVLFLFFFGGSVFFKF